MNIDNINNWLQGKINILLSNKELIIMIIPIIWCFFITLEYMFEIRYCKYWGIEKWYKNSFSIAFHPKYAKSLFLSIMWLGIMYCIIDLALKKQILKYLPMNKIIFFSIFASYISLVIASYRLKAISVNLKKIERSQKELKWSELKEYREKARKAGKIKAQSISIVFWINSFGIAFGVLTYYKHAFGIFCILFIVLYYLVYKEYYLPQINGELLFKVDYFYVIEDDDNYYSILLPVQEIDGKNNLLVRTYFCRAKSGIVTAYVDNSDCKYIDNISDIKVKRAFYDKVRRISYEDSALLSSKEKEELIYEDFIRNKEDDTFSKGKWNRISSSKNNNMSNSKKGSKNK